MEARAFGTSQRAALYTLADGRCEKCGAELAEGWHADHIHPWSKGGATDMDNGQALCPSCNLKKGDSPPDGLRAWQREALRQWDQRQRFMLAACPGAGKTRFALEAGSALLRAGRINRIDFVVPGTALVGQTIDSAVELGLRLRDFHNGRSVMPADAHGRVITYQQVVAAPFIYARGAERAFVVLDEAHHMGEEAAWGEKIRQAFVKSPHLLLMTGTPWRTDGSAIPFAEFDDSGELVVDYRYEFAQAWADQNRPIRGVSFQTLDADGRGIKENSAWRLKGSEVVTDQEESDVLRSFHDPSSHWIIEALDRSVRELDLAKKSLPDAQGLILARDNETANEYGRICRARGMSCTVVHGKTDNAHDNLASFGKSGIDWLIAVKMVSEGYDNPRLSVLLHASDAKTDLSFHQALGRVIRRSSSEDRSVARVLVPHTPSWARLVKSVDDTRTYALREEEPSRSADRSTPSSEASERFVLPAENAEIGQQTQKGMNEEERLEDFLHRLRQLPEAEQHQYIAIQHERITASRPVSTAPRPITQAERKDKRATVNRLVKKIARRIVEADRGIERGLAHAKVWSSLNGRVGQNSNQARTDTQLDDDIRVCERWLAHTDPEWGFRWLP